MRRGEEGEGKINQMFQKEEYGKEDEKERKIKKREVSNK